MTTAIFPMIQSGSPPKKEHPTDIIKDISYKDIAEVNVVFINMPLRETAVPTITPEGPLLMATNLIKNYGVNASIIDLNAYRIKDEVAEQRGLPNGRRLNYNETLAKIRNHFRKHGEPTLVGLSGMITTLERQQEVSRIVKDLFPNVFLLSGNGLATELKTNLFGYIPELDAVARSEGDDVIVKAVYDAKIIREQGMASAINSGKLLPYYLGAINGQHRVMYEGNRPRNLDALPFNDLELIREDADGFQVLEVYLGNPKWGGKEAKDSSATPFTMERSTNSSSSRGCPFDCEYCNRNAQGERNWGTRSAEHMAQELMFYIQNYRADFHCYVDDNFAVRMDRIKDMVEVFRAHGIKIPWGTHTRLDEMAGIKLVSGKLVTENPLRVELMAKSGCKYVGAGPESASERVLEAIGKGGHTLKNGLTSVLVNGKAYNFPVSMIEGIKRTVEVGVHVNCTWIMASPTETLEDLKQTVAFMKWQEEYYSGFGISPDAVNKRMFTMTWYPGTKMIRHERVRKELKRVFGLDFNDRHEPICNDAFYKYLIELDDATKVMHGENDEPLNFGDMPTDQFLQAREYADTDQIFKISDMQTTNRP